MTYTHKNILQGLKYCSYFKLTALYKVAWKQTNGWKKKKTKCHNNNNNNNTSLYLLLYCSFCLYVDRTSSLLGNVQNHQSWCHEQHWQTNCPWGLMVAAIRALVSPSGGCLMEKRKKKYFFLVPVLPTLAAACYNEMWSHAFRLWSPDRRCLQWPTIFWTVMRQWKVIESRPCIYQS